MGIFDKFKKTILRQRENNLIFKINKYKVNKFHSVENFPNKLSNFIHRGNVGCNFSVTLYKCPCCKSNPLYKTTFPTGKEYKIITTIGPIYMEEIFTCPNCYRVFTPLQDEFFECGQIFTIKLDNEIEYIDYLLPFNIFGIEGGSK